MNRQTFKDAVTLEELRDKPDSPEHDRVDTLIHILETRGLGWSLDHTGGLIEVRIWDWPYAIARYRPKQLEPLHHMLAQAMYQIDWTKYPAKEETKNETH